MKYQISLLFLLFPLTNAQCLKNNPEYAILDVRKTCDFDSVLQASGRAMRKVTDETGDTCSGRMKELKLLLDVKSTDDLVAKVNDICDDITSRTKTNIAASANTDDLAVQFETIPLGLEDADSEAINRFLSEFYDGGTFYNEYIQQRGPGQYILNSDTQGIKSFYQNEAQNKLVQWPSTSVSNFDTCEINAAMCCWVQDRQANDDNGNCNTPYPVGNGRDLWTPDDCIDKDPADNTDICYVDMSRSPKSNHVVEGAVIYDDQDTVREGDAHCHGFAWADDVNSDSHRFRGNNLFFVSMYDHLRQRGYVRNVPGAPMCGCVEQMPTVTRSDCTEVEVTENFTLTYKADTNTLEGGVTSVNVAFNACQGINGNNNNLLAHYEKLVDDGEVTPRSTRTIEEIIVGDNNCAPAINNFLENEFGIVRI